MSLGRIPAIPSADHEILVEGRNDGLSGRDGV